MPITLDTPITVGELSMWKLRWLYVNLKYDWVAVRRNASIEDVADLLNTARAGQAALLQQWNTIYDHPTGLTDQIRSSGYWKELDQLIAQIAEQTLVQQTKRIQKLVADQLGVVPKFGQEAPSDGE